MPREVVAAFPTIRDLKEVHARRLKPHLGRAEEREAILAEARILVAEAGAGGPRPDANGVMARLRGAVARPKAKAQAGTNYRRAREESGITVRQKGSKVTVAFGANLSRDGLEGAFRSYLKDRFGG